MNTIRRKKQRGNRSARVNQLSFGSKLSNHTSSRFVKTICLFEREGESQRDISVLVKMRFCYPGKKSKVAEDNGIARCASNKRLLLSCTQRSTLKESGPERCNSIQQSASAGKAGRSCPLASSVMECLADWIRIEASLAAFARADSVFSRIDRHPALKIKGRGAVSDEESKERLYF